MKGIIMKKYIEAKIKKLLETSDPKGYLMRLASSNQELHGLWEKELEMDNACWQRINTNEDVINLIDRFDGQVHFVEDNVPYGSGHIEDGYNMALAEYRAIQGLRKMAQFIDSSHFTQTKFVPLSETEIDELFERINDIITRMNQQNFRRAMQD